MGRRRVLIACVAMALAAAAWLGQPGRHMVEGVSMAPGLLPGDVVTTGWFPALDRIRRPRRFERWVVAATDGLAIKRVVGLPGEEVAIVAGDLVIDGEPVLAPPHVLAEMASQVSRPDGAREAVRGGWRWRRDPAEILDAVDVATTRTSLLLPARDIGVAAVVDVRRLSEEGAVRVRATVGRMAVTWRLTSRARHALVAGRLDGRLVAASWGLPDAGPAWTPGRSSLPPGPPAAWGVVRPWPSTPADGPPLLMIESVTPGGDAVLEAACGWRDAVHRPAADGTAAWLLGPDEFLVLGDHPAASTDSRRWGPVSRARLTARVWPE